jgi:diapolycopene oxygenase
VREMIKNRKRKKVIVVGAELGGISAAVSLAQEGYEVEMYEKNDKIGGKLNFLQAQGYTFDLGPSILTLPHLLERLFERSSRRMADYFSIRPVRPHWRNFFEDGTVIDLRPERELMAKEAEKAGETPSAVQGFLQYSERLYDMVDSGYFQQGLDSAREFRDFYALTKFLQFDLFRTMHGAVVRRLKSRYLRDIFDFFIKYVGSSAYDAPAFMNCLPTIQFRHDLWYVDGGMYNIARGLQKLMTELGIRVHLNTEIKEIRASGSRVEGVLVNGDQIAGADIVVCNVDVIPAYRELMDEDARFLERLQKFEPSCSGLVLDLGLDKQYPQIAHHNFFFSGDQREHFHSVFHKKVLPDDPTIYVVAASKTDPSVTPPGCDCLKILPHIPYIDEARPLGMSDYVGFKNRILDKLERVGLKDLRKHVVFEHMWTPLDIQREYRSNQGSIYGVVSDRRKNLAFKAPKQSTRYENLFFAGGSVNPGAGVPMVVLCGPHVCRRVVEWDSQ